MRHLRILIVDDDALIGSLLADMLADLGHQVCGIEATEAGAVRAAREGEPDLMIVDVHLRAGSGLGAVETICRAGVIPHILMSGTHVSLGGPRMIALRKPFRTRDLVDAIPRALDVARSAAG